MMKVTNDEELGDCIHACAKYMLRGAFEAVNARTFSRSYSYRQKTTSGGEVLTKATVKRLKTKQTFNLDIKLKENLGE